MISLPEQLSAARKWQLEVQLDFFRALSTQVLARTEQVIALNLDTSRAAVERSSNAVKQLFAINDPRDLATLGSQGRAQFEQMLAYSRELFSIASGAQAPLARQAEATPLAPAAASTPPAPPAAFTPWAPAGASSPWAPAAPQAAAAPQPAPAAVPAPAPAASNDAAAAAAHTEHFAKGVKPSKKPLVATFPEPAPEPAKAKPIAKAAGTLATQPAEPQHPLSSPVAEAGGQVEIPLIAPVEAAPPPAPVSGTPAIEVKQAQRAAAKGNRKK
jgi:phasin family protein